MKPYFVELLRAKRAIFVAAIILGLLLLCAIVLRLSTLGTASMEDWGYMMEHSSTAHVTRQTLADGTRRTIVDDPVKRRHAVIERKDRSFSMVLDEPTSSVGGHDHIVWGGDFTEVDRGGMAHITAHYTFSIPFGMLMIFTLPIGLLVATILAGALAKENDGHLELAWTKPFSRERYAVSAIATDAIAIWFSQLLALGVYLLCIVIFVVPPLTFTDHFFETLGLTVIGPIAWYGLLTAASASMKRGLGMVVGLGWPVAIIVPFIAGATSRGHNVLAQGMHAIFAPLAYIDPLQYLAFNGHGPRMDGPLGPVGYSVAALAVLAIVYIAAAVLQWRRVEA